MSDRGFGWGWRVFGLFPVVVLLLLFQGEAFGREAFDAEMEASEERAENYGRDLESLIDEVADAGVELSDVQTEADALDGRVSELSARVELLEEELELRREERARAEEVYGESLVSAYRGAGVEGLSLAIGGILGGGEVLDPAIERVLLQGREDIEDRLRAEDEIRQNIRQVEATKREQRDALGKQRETEQSLSDGIRRMRESQEELRAEIESEQSGIQRIRVEKLEYQRKKLEELKRSERARIDAEAAASGGDSSRRDEEVRVSEEGIYAQETEALPYEDYLSLYRESAEKYGFGEDWHILAAIGKIESDHGQNLGPSSAGAMGPMQFLPSTWETSGVDGNGDGAANIMDPEDAIPAAAGYLVAGGAPEDWYAAIYSYNHADWYVQEVMSVADAYREMEEGGTLR